MRILGVSFDYHDSAAALVLDGSVVAAAQEERFSRLKNDASLPRQAICFCLQAGGVRGDDLDAIIFYERPLLKFERILRSYASNRERNRQYFSSTLESWLRKGKIDPVKRLSASLGVSTGKIHTARHHLSHAASAFFCSPFENAAIVTLDGVGEYETGTICSGRGNRIEQIASVKLPHSLGLVFSAFTAFLGFEVNEGEYKVMGMAAFGEARYAASIRSWMQLHTDGTFSVNQKYFEFQSPVDMPFTSAMIEALGPAREPESPFSPNADDESRRWADVAASVQKVTEEVVLHVCGSALKRVGTQNLCMAGGVALNSVANGRVQRELGAQMYVQPAAGDAGGAIGAALFHYYRTLQREREPGSIPLPSPYLGKEYAECDILSALRNRYIRNFQRFEHSEQLCAHVSDMIARGKVVGWVQGRFEWGPRALGARSILADPSNPAMQAIVNEKIKFREPFRPFAPAVLAHRAREFFDLPPDRTPASPESYMLSVASVLPGMRSAIPAVTHVDGTARVQLVWEETNPLFFRLIVEFEKRSGIPMLLNTSFNLRGEPIVSSPGDAIQTFSWSDMDALVLGNYVAVKN